MAVRFNRTRACGTECGDNVVENVGPCGVPKSKKERGKYIFVVDDGACAGSKSATSDYFSTCGGSSRVVTASMRDENATIIPGVVAANGLLPSSLTLQASAVSSQLARPLSEAGVLASSASGREVLRYLAQCALPAGAHLTVGSAEFAGGFGLAPEWVSEGLSTAQQEALTSCFLAHVNETGTKVPIQVAAVGSAMSADVARDGVFFGDLATGERYSCEQSAASESPYSAARVCDAPGNRCGITSLGACSSVCDAQGCTAPSGRRFSHPVEVRLPAL
jgi:hypothetical protein